MCKNLSLWKIHKKSYNTKTKSNDSAKEVVWTYENLFIYYQNVRRLRKKNHIIKPKTFETEYDIIALTETCFDSGNNNDEYFCDKFSIFRCDRSVTNSRKSTGGGCLIAIKKNVNYKIEQINLDEFNDIELVGARIWLHSKK